MLRLSKVKIKLLSSQVHRSSRSRSLHPHRREWAVLTDCGRRSSLGSADVSYVPGGSESRKSFLTPNDHGEKREVNSGRGNQGSVWGVSPMGRFRLGRSRGLLSTVYPLSSQSEGIRGVPLFEGNKRVYSLQTQHPNKFTIRTHSVLDLPPDLTQGSQTGRSFTVTN